LTATLIIISMLLESWTIKEEDPMKVIPETDRAL